MTPFTAPEPTPAARFACDPASVRRDALGIIIASLVAGAAMIGSSLLFKLDLSGPARVGVALLPTPPFIAMFVLMVRMGRRLDEMQVRIQMEALACTLLFAAVGVITWGRFQKAGFLPMTEVSSVWVLIAFVYIACYLLTLWRYR